MVIVFDTNTLISGVLKPDGIPAKAINRAATLGSLVLSSETKRELLEVIHREKFDRYIEKAERVARADAAFFVPVLNVQGLRNRNGTPFPHGIKDTP